MAIEMQVDEVPCEIWLDPIKIDSLLRLAENAPLKLLFQAGIADKPGPGASDGDLALVGDLGDVLLVEGSPGVVHDPGQAVDR